MNKRYYYVRFSFVRNDKSTLVYSECAIDIDNEDTPFLPLMAIIRWAMRRFKDIAIIETIQVCNYIEISEQDYNEFIELRNSQGWNASSIRLN